MALVGSRPAEAWRCRRNRYRVRRESDSQGLDRFSCSRSACGFHLLYIPWRRLFHVLAELPTAASSRHAIRKRSAHLCRQRVSTCSTLSLPAAGRCTERVPLAAQPRLPGAPSRVAGDSTGGQLDTATALAHVQLDCRRLMMLLMSPVLISGHANSPEQRELRRQDPFASLGPRPALLTSTWLVQITAMSESACSTQTSGPCHRS